jgi:hypothetical protein
MDEPTVSTTESQIAAPAVVAPEQSLEDIYREAGIPESQAQITAIPAPVAAVETKPIPDAIPDAYEEGHKAFLQSLLDKTNAIEKNQTAQLQRQAQIERAGAAARLEEEITEATKFVKETAGFDGLPYTDEGKLQLARFELESRATTDPKFKQLWDNRNTSPAHKAALQKALTVISKDVSKKFEGTVDPKLSADRRALKAAQSTSATTETDSRGNALEGLSGTAFEQAWQRMLSGG